MIADRPSVVTSHRLAVVLVWAALAFAALHAPPAGGTEIAVVGLFPGKAVLVVDGAAPKTYAVGGQVAAGVRLLRADDESATVAVDGVARLIPLGSHVNRAPADAGNSITLQADARGHYIAQGSINGGSIRMLVDTGATMISLPAADARRLGIDYRKGQPGTVETANGPMPVYRVRLDSVGVGDVHLSQVDAVVQEGGLPYALLGMSFLSRTDMNRSGEQLTLTQRY